MLDSSIFMLLCVKLVTFTREGLGLVGKGGLFNSQPQILLGPSPQVPLENATEEWGVNICMRRGLVAM